MQLYKALQILGGGGGGICSMESSAAESCPLLGLPQKVNWQRWIEPPSVRFCWLVVTFGFFLWPCWRLLGIPWTFVALRLNLFMADSDHQLDPGNNTSHRISLCVNAGPCPWEPKLPSSCFYAQLRTTVTGSNFHKSWRHWIYKRLTAGLHRPAPRRPLREQLPVFSLHCAGA